MNTQLVTDQLWDDVRLAVYLDIPERTPAQWRYRGCGPRYMKVGRHIRYRSSDVDAWLASQSRGGDAA